jgi:FkbM family methyltransferase
MRIRSNRAGMEIIGAEFSGLGTWALAATFMIPPTLREALLFGKSRFCLPLQKALAWLLGGAQLVETRFTEGPMAGDSFQCWTSEKYFMLGSRVETDAQEKLGKVIHPGQVVYDIGGYAGYMSLLFATLVGSDGRVFAFEPSPVNLPRIRHNLARNGKTNVVVIEAAASDQEGVVRFQESGSMSGIVGDDDSGGGATATIKTMKLDDFAYRDRHPLPDFLKIDIEGHAGAALAGMERILAERHPVILCELHDAREQGQVTRTLTAHGYQFEPLDGDQAFPRRVIATADGK